jgi:DNA modification methylase
MRAARRPRKKSRTRLPPATRKGARGVAKLQARTRSRLLVNPRILRTGFLSRKGPKTDHDHILGKTVALQLGGREVSVEAVATLPRRPKRGATYVLLNDKESKALSMHNLVRFPAKLHPPFVKWAIERYTKPGSIVLDPFCGCGTVVLEATLKGRRAVGFDVDPYSAYIADAKCNPPSKKAFDAVVTRLKNSLADLQRTAHTYERLEKEDITRDYYRTQIEPHRVPAIPNISHWFKHYIIVDLLNIWSKIGDRRDPPRLKRYVRTAFASILRLCSNADPDTLSGLEVTKRMRLWMRRGRHINPIAIFSNRLGRNSDPILEKYWTQAKTVEQRYAARIRNSSALDGRSYRGYQTKIDAIITSPPYCSAVEYQRRHTLEHYWLGFLRSESGIPVMRKRYIGRRNYVNGDVGELMGALPKGVRDKLTGYLGPLLEEKRSRTRAIVSYFVEMAQWLRLALDQLKPRGHLVLVVGDSTVKGRPVRTGELLADLAPAGLRLTSHFSYVLRNRSMQYSRWNHADVTAEQVMVFTKVSRPSKTRAAQNGRRAR